jgi:hypothetical protein
MGFEDAAGYPMYHRYISEKRGGKRKKGEGRLGVTGGRRDVGMRYRR